MQQGRGIGGGERQRHISRERLRLGREGDEAKPSHEPSPAPSACNLSDAHPYLQRPLWQTNLLLTAGGARSPGRHSPSLLHTPSGRSPSLQCPSPAPSADVRSSLGKTLAGGDLDTLADTSSATPKQQQLSAWGGSAAARAVKLVSSTPAKPVFGASARSESPPVFGLGAFGKGKVEAEAQKQKEMQEGGEEASQGFERQEAGKEDGEEGGGDPAAKRQRMEEAQVGNREDSRGEDADRLDPIALHRSFCPWVNTGGQAGGVRLKCGWMHVLDALPRGGAAAADSTEADEDHAPHRLAVSSVRDDRCERVVMERAGKCGNRMGAADEETRRGARNGGRQKGSERGTMKNCKGLWRGWGTLLTNPDKPCTDCPPQQVQDYTNRFLSALYGS